MKPVFNFFVFMLVVISCIGTAGVHLGRAGAFLVICAAMSAAAAVASIHHQPGDHDHERSD